jgi:chromosomal replication initiator protein
VRYKKKTEGKNMDSIWDTIRPNLKLRLGTNYDAWCSRLQVIHENDTQIIFLSPNKYFSEYVKNNFFPTIEEELKKVTNRSYDLFFSTTQENFQIKSEIKPSPTQPKIQKKTTTSKTSAFDTLSKFDRELLVLQQSLPNQGNTSKKVSSKNGQHIEYSKAKSSEKKIFLEKTFENFVVGNSNRLAHAASYAVCEDPGSSYNPLFIHGSTGLGKTHLMKAIASKLTIERPNLKIIYVSAEQFTNEMVQAFRFRSTTKFHKKFREECDVLLMDDVQFLREKQRTQEELFHVFEVLQNSGRQIVFTADVSPKDIPGFEKRLRSRFESGMMADIRPPKMNTLLAILEQKSIELGLQLNSATKSYIIKEHLSNSTPNVRELEGRLIQLKALAKLQNTTPNVQLLTSHFGETSTSNQNQEISVDSIMNSVCRVLGVDRDKVLGSSRKKNLVHSRHIAIYLIRTHTSLSLPEIGRRIGNRDHTTIRHAYQKILDLLPTDPDLQNTISFIEKEVLM